MELPHLVEEATQAAVIPQMAVADHQQLAVGGEILGGLGEQPQGNMVPHRATLMEWRVQQDHPEGSGLIRHAIGVEDQASVIGCHEAGSSQITTGADYRLG